jgi:hypothetical protein
MSHIKENETKNVKSASVIFKTCQKHVFVQAEQEKLLFDETLI